MGVTKRIHEMPGGTVHSDYPASASIEESNSTYRIATNPSPAVRTIFNAVSKKGLPGLGKKNGFRLSVREG